AVRAPRGRRRPVPRRPRARGADRALDAGADPRRPPAAGRAPQRRARRLHDVSRPLSRGRATAAARRRRRRRGREPAARRHPARDPVKRWLWALAAAPGVVQLALLVFAIGRRFAFPYDLEWMEGGMLNHALRLSEGHTIYPPPSVDFIPF